MNTINNVLVTGTGAVAGAIVRALVPAGYNVTTIGMSEHGLTVFKRFNPKWEQSPQTVDRILKGDLKVDPFLDLYTPECTQKVPHIYLDLSDKLVWTRNPFHGADAVILTAANPDPDQSQASAAINHQIDRNTIDAAIEAGYKQIILTSSLLRTRGKLEDPSIEYKTLITPDMESPWSTSYYAQAKADSVRYLRKVAEAHEDRMFAHIDLGWYPRETVGLPTSNIEGRVMQFWIAECELQQHYLLLLSIAKNPKFQEDFTQGANYFSFNGVSRNVYPMHFPPRNHPRFPYDISNSEKLGVKHQFNVYTLLDVKMHDWRRIPVFST